MLHQLLRIISPGKRRFGKIEESHLADFSSCTSQMASGRPQKPRAALYGRGMRWDRIISAGNAASLKVQPAQIVLKLGSGNDLGIYMATRYAPLNAPNIWAG